MKFSQSYINSIRGEAKDYDSVSHAMLVQAGFIDQVASGIYTFLPPGQRVLRKIENIVRQEMNDIEAEEITLPTLQPKVFWTQTKRWDTVDVLYKVQSRHGGEYALAASGEDVITPLAKKYVTSYKDLPLALYQINQKYRDEARAKSGILRGREFRMKDLYSFHASQDDLNQYYKKVTDAYFRIFSRCGLDDVKITEASGGDFTNNHSHEFNVITPAGEVDLVYCSSCDFAQNEEVVKKTLEVCPKCGEKTIQKNKAIEVGNIFDLGTKFSQACDLKYVDDGGKRHLVLCASYGIGTSRLVGAIAEVNHDEYGMIWPKTITPFHVHLVNLHKDDTAFADLIYRTIRAEGFDVLYDDRANVSAGEKFVTADLIGTPIRLVVSPKTEQSIEWKERTETKTHLLSPTDTVNKLHEFYL
jgi:prolyl-tRNA synthetase